MFLVRKGEIEGRLDATAYRPAFNYSSAKFEIEKLSKVALINPKVSFDQLDNESEISFVPMEVVDEINGTISELRFKKVKDSKGFTRFQENDLIWAKITPCMQNGKSAVARNLKQGFACGSTEFYIIHPKSDNVLVDYLHILLRDERVLENAQNFFGGSAGQQRVSIAFLKNLKIPVPPIETQAKIVALFEAAYAQKRSKEAEAKAFLAGIDGYLLYVLGIILPQPTEKKKFFYTHSSKVSGGRFDPKKYTPESERLVKSLSKGKFETVVLKDLVIQSVSGDWGIDEAKEGFEERLVIRATEFDNRFNLNLDNSRVKYRFISQSKLEKMNLQVNDLLIEKSGGSEDQPVGRIAIITKELSDNHSLAFSNFIHKIRVDSNKINCEYLFDYLKTIHNIKFTDLMQSQTNGIRNLIMKEYFYILIPLPPLAAQTEIANHIAEIRSKAKRLELEAKEIVEQAKARVEKTILGEA